MYSICYGDRKISYNIHRKKVKNINLRINSNLEVSVSANEDVPLEYIEKFVKSKAKWIDKHLNYYKKMKDIDQGKKEYVNGESFRYLGKQYRLKVFNSSEEKVKYFRGYIHLYTKDINNFKKKESLMEDWYRERSRLVFKESLDKMYKLIRVYNIDYPILDIRKMKSRWGTCYPGKNKIIINSTLIKAPKDCIDYVVLHELIHFKHMNHKSDFYRLLDILMPDWRYKKKILDEVIIRDL